MELIALLSFVASLLLGGGLLLWWRQSQKLSALAELCEGYGEGFCLFDNAKCLIASPPFKSFTQIEGPLQTYHDLKSVLEGQDVEFFDRYVIQLLRKKKPFESTFKSAKTQRWIEFSGTPLARPNRWVLWAKDVTYRMDQGHEKEGYIRSLHQKIEQLESILDALPFAVWHRNEDQKIDVCNAYFSQAVEASKENIYQQSLELLNPTKAKGLARKALNSGTPQKDEVYAIAFDQRRKYLIHETPSDRGTAGYALDKTDVDQDIKKYLEIVKSYEGILEHLSTAISIYDEEGVLQYFNPAYCTLNDMAPEFLQTKPTLDEILELLRRKRQLPETPDFPAYKQRRLRQLKELIEPQEELVHLPDERTLRMFRTSHPSGGIIYMFEDVTGKLALERKNKALVEVQDVAFENLYEAVLVFGSDHCIKISNPSFRTIWGLEEADVEPGQHISRVVEKIAPYFDHIDDWPTQKVRILENITDRVAKGGKIFRNDETVLYFSYVPLPNGDHLLSYIDVTDSTKVQNALKDRNEALEATDRLKSEFIANVSYELRDPLNTITGFTEMLSKNYGGDLNHTQREYVEGILSSSDKLLKLVDNILDLASVEAGYIALSPYHVDVSEMLESLARLVSMRASDMSIQIEVKCHKKVTTWMMDDNRIKQALFNLISNALAFTPEGGTITLEATTKDNELVLSVSDTGPGIPKKEQSRIFEKFERGASSKTGVGLGLSLVKSLIELHGGAVKLTSRLGAGTKVSCILPSRVPANQDDPDEVAQRKIAD